MKRQYLVTALVLLFMGFKNMPIPHSEFMGCRPASLENRKIVEMALKDCGITEKVIVLESDRTDAEAVTYAQNNQRYIVIFHAQNNSEEFYARKMFAAYHECGHIYLQNAPKKSLLQCAGLLAITGITACLGINLLRSFDKSNRWMPALTKMGALALASHCASNAASCMHHIRPERETDIFAAQKLIAHGKKDIVQQRINLYQKSHNITSTIFYKWFLLACGIPHAAPPEQVAYLTNCLSAKTL